MDAIEIFFAAYGALLAIAAANLLAAAARLIRKPTDVRIGWSTPLLLLLVFLDICSFTASTSRTMGLADLSSTTVTTALLAAGAYCLAARLIAPTDFADWKDLDTYYDRYKVWVIGGTLFASIMGFEVMSLLVRGLEETVQLRWKGVSTPLIMSFYVILGVLLVIRNRATNLVLLGTLNAIFLVALFTA